MSKRLLAAALGTALLTGGCATLIGGGPAEFHVNVSEPRQDLEVRIAPVSGGEALIRRTPEFTVSLARSTDYTVTVRSPLYETQEIRIGRSIRPIFWLNFLSVLPFGMIVDAVTSNMWEPSPQQVTFRLERARQGSNGDWVLPIVLVDGLTRKTYEAPILN